MTPGTPIRFIGKNLGLVSNIDNTRFEEHTVRTGDSGTYVGPHPSPRLPGWHVIAVDVDGTTLYCPCTTTQFEETA